MMTFRHTDWFEGQDVLVTVGPGDVRRGHVVRVAEALVHVVVEGNDLGPLAFHIGSGECPYSESISVTTRAAS